MKTIIIIGTLFLSISETTAQNSCTHPPVVFPNGKTICDTRPLKTVFFDDFNGTTLQSPWIKFNSWMNMIGGDNDRWEHGHEDRNVIVKDENVVVSNGTVKLKVKRELSIWKCDACPNLYTRRYSGSALSLPYNNSYITNGYIEARIKMPTFFKAHTTMWLWDSGPIVNEIDIAEGYGEGGNGGFLGDFPKVNHSTHAWWLKRDSIDNPCNLPKDKELMDRYPNNTWWNWNFDRTFKPYEFNTYACDWDTSRVRFYLNGSEVGTVWKYYGYKDIWVNNYDPTYGYTPSNRSLKKVLVGSACTGDGSTVWNVTPGFPYHTNAPCQLRFTANLDNTADMALGWPQLPDAFLGEMEIDYVKIAQRTIDPGYTPCDDPITPVAAPQNLCENSAVTISASQPVSTGTWSSSTNISILSQNSSSAVITSAPNATSGVGHVYYNPNNPNCNFSGAQRTKRNIFLWKPGNAIVNVARFVTGVFFNKQGYFLTASAPNLGLTLFTGNPSSPETYEWEVDYGPNYSYHYHTFGRTISVPTIPYTYNSPDEIKWKLAITNICGVTIRNGEGIYLPAQRGAPKSPEELQEGNTQYWRADITDFASYDLAVDDRISKTMFPPEADTLDIIAAIEEIRMDELAPYLLDSVMNVSNAGRFASSDTRLAPEDVNTETESEVSVRQTISVSPNPAQNLLYLNISGSRLGEEPMLISIIDLYGRQVYSATELPANHIPVPIANLPAGIYFLKAKVAQSQEVIRFVKE